MRKNHSNTGLSVPRHSLRTRLMLPVLAVLIIIFFVNFFMFFRLNRFISSLNKVYETSIELNDLESGLRYFHNNARDYLNTQSDNSLNSYQEQNEALLKLIYRISPRISSNISEELERNIFFLAKSYFEEMHRAVLFKQAHNSGYHESFIAANEIYQYLLKNVQALRELRFRTNSENYDLLYTSILNLERFILMILLIHSCLMLMVLYEVLGGVIEPLRQLSEQVVQIEKGNYNLSISIPAYEDEVAILSKAFSRMLDGVRESIRKIRESTERELELKKKEMIMENLLKDAQLKLYQAQINPHFLFNTLNAGQQLAMLEEAERTYHFINNTAQFFRAQLQGSRGQSTLADELTLVDNYLYIMNVRFGNEFIFDKKIDEELISVAFPGMVLQPIIENSINHAFPGEWEGDKKIKLSIEDIGSEIKISVIDNGCGIPDNISIKINEGEEASNKSEAIHSGVGLLNVRERIIMLYGNEAAFWIGRAAESHGTSVIIHIPKGDRDVQNSNRR